MRHRGLPRRCPCTTIMLKHHESICSPQVSFKEAVAQARRNWFDTLKMPRIGMYLQHRGASSKKNGLSDMYRGGPLWCTRFRRVFRSRKWAREIGQKPGEDVVWQRNAGRRQPPPQAHFISPNPPRHSRRSVSDGVIQLRATRRLCGLFSASPHPP